MVKNAFAKVKAAKIVAAVAALGLITACGNGSDGGAGTAIGNGTGVGLVGTTPDGGSVAVEAGYATGTNIPLPLAPAHITWVHNGTEDPQRSYWEQVAHEFEALHPGVTVTVTAVENQTLRDAVLPNTIAAGSTPDLFQSWGGGQLTEWVNEGVLRDLSDVLAPTISNLQPGAVQNWQLNGNSYGLPYAVGPAGFWVNLNLLNEAGLVTSATTDADGNVTSGTVDWPTDLDGLISFWATLKDHGITPVAVGGGSGWAGPFWYYALVAATCSPEAIDAANTMRNFDDACWEQAGNTLKQIVGLNVFNDGWGTTDAQGGPDSSAGLVATGRAAMELQGPWGGTVISSIYQTQAGHGGEAPGFLAWYPFPAVSGGHGGGSILASGDGFSVLDPSLTTQEQSDAAAALLAFILSDAVQSKGLNFDQNGAAVVALPGIPTNPAVAAQIVDPVMAKQAQALTAATTEVPWLDVFFGSTIGSALNNSVNSVIRGQLPVSSIVDQINTAAGNH